ARPGFVSQVMEMQAGDPGYGTALEPRLLGIFHLSADLVAEHVSGELVRVPGRVVLDHLQDASDTRRDWNLATLAGLRILGADGDHASGEADIRPEQGEQFTSAAARL